MNENGENTIRDLAVGSFIAAFAALMMILYEPAEQRPKLWAAVGRIGIAMVASLLVGAIASDVFNYSPKLVYAACGGAGVFGDRIFLAAARFLKSKYGIDLSKEKAEDKEEVKNNGEKKGNENV